MEFWETVWFALEAVFEIPITDALEPVLVFPDEFVKFLITLLEMVAAGSPLKIPIAAAAVPAVLVTLIELGILLPMLLLLMVAVAADAVLILIPAKELLPVADVFPTLKPAMSLLGQPVLLLLLL